MKFTTAIFSIVALVAGTEACKCFNGGSFNIIDTRTCCDRAGGLWDGRDCPDFTMPNPATVFNDCCQQHGSSTDC
ncbi:hypothetical protein PWT90_02593 [Aphanocladium album]|nr:hypothetical protein PWT90_02593 [Aphanocladium album]